MSHERERPDGRGRVTEDAVEAMLRAAGPRPSPSPEILARFERVARQAWREKVAEVRAAEAPISGPPASGTPGRRRAAIWAIAALIVTALGAGFLGQRLLRSDTEETVATVLVGRQLAPSIIAAGKPISTGVGERLALRLGGGAQLRVDESSRIMLDGGDRIRLEAGAVYAEAAGEDVHLTVATPFGTATDIGTRFAVRVLDGGVEVLVRDGAVRLETPSARHLADAGERLLVRAGAAERQAITGDDPAWNWTLESAPPFDADGASVAAILDWVAHETGWRIRYADSSLEETVRGIIFQGSLDGVRPDQAPDIVLPSARLDFVRAGGEIVVRRAPAP